jgi:hypothetical protein
MIYVAELDNNNIVIRVIVADDVQWCIDNLGGQWQDTTGLTYPGPGWWWNGIDFVEGSSGA